MSYSDSVKESILGNELKKVCCSRALACGLLLGVERLPTDGMGKDEEIFLFRSEQESVALLAQRLLKLRFGKETELSETHRPGHTVYLIEFSSKPVSRFLRAIEQELPDSPAARREALSLKCPECHAAFLRGLFLGCGSISDPQSAFHLEFRLPAERADAVASLLSEEDEPPKRVKRREKVGLYYKKSTVIGEFFSLIGENGLYFAIADKQIERQIRASENRITNCEMKNLEKTVNASLAQIAAVKALFLSGEIERMPQELRETAVLRLEYDNDSLSSLAARHVPPITKSGLNNRLRRIMEAARDIEVETDKKDSGE